ncbi:hypothetical protein [Thermococcus thioreducens]|uniref:Uncharacterized protein n=1 Tax=Thermococcus thioreducens TaxID=277988 RepID=A0A1I0PPM7_9EURY|nr:hypothetical protein [Thermococcus thioreducens]SEW16350.1 hypothetical protein SAMN05216170_1979 [Thermococcus thioreducens]
MFERVKPEPALNAKEIKIDFFEDEVEPVERPRIKFLFEVKRNRSA